MACHYHPDRESTDTCAICGKSICKECGLEIAGKIYCKECLEKIVGLGIDNSTNTEVVEEPIETEPATNIDDEIDTNIYQPQEEYDIDAYSPEESIYAQEPEYDQSRKINDDSPYNIKNNINYSGGLESSYLYEAEAPQNQAESQPQITQDEIEHYAEEILQEQAISQSPDYIYPDHEYEPAPTSARQELEDKYERYLDDLYFDENEVPLGEQLAKDEAQYGSLTRRPYQPKVEEEPVQKAPQQPPATETPEQMEARIRAEIAREMSGSKDEDNSNIHNLNYKDEKEPMGVIDILLTIILIIVILIVIYYLVYLFMLSSIYPTFMDAVFALSNPQNVINNILSS